MSERFDNYQGVMSHLTPLEQRELEERQSELNQLSTVVLEQWLMQYEVQKSEYAEGSLTAEGYARDARLIEGILRVRRSAEKARALESFGILRVGDSHAVQSPRQMVSREYPQVAPRHVDPEITSALRNIPDTLEAETFPDNNIVELWEDGALHRYDLTDAPREEVDRIHRLIDAQQPSLSPAVMKVIRDAADRNEPTDVFNRAYRQRVATLQKSSIPAAPKDKPTAGKSMHAFGTDRIGRPKEQVVTDEEIQNLTDASDQATGKKTKWYRRKSLTLGTAGVAALAVGVPMLITGVHSDKHAEVHANKPLTGVSPQEIAAIAKKKNPDITPASIAIGQCLTDPNGSPLSSGHASGVSMEAWVYKNATNGTLMGAQTPDNKYLPIEVQSAPFDVAACAPADARAGMVTIKGNAITIDKSKVTPQIRMAAGPQPVPTILKFAAAPELGLTSDGAKALNAAQVNVDNKNKAATIMYANLARAIAQKGSVDLGRVEAQMDTDWIQSIDNQIDDFYEKQGRNAPAFNLTFTGNYLDAKVIDPAGLQDILTKTKDVVRLTPAELTALDFNAATSTTKTATPAPAKK